VNTVQNKIFIMDFTNQHIGIVERTASSFVQTLAGHVTAHNTLPPIMCGIAPEPSQFPSANDVLAYYDREKLDVSTYLARSNGLKSSRDYWFMAEPVGEVWIPLFIGMHPRYTSFESYNIAFKTGDAVQVLMNGKTYINRHTMDILPPCILPYLTQDGETRFSTATGYVKDLAPYPATKGIIGRIILTLEANPCKKS
jgi:hypothetical protein